QSGGIANDTTVLSGGFVTVLASGILNNLTASSGARSVTVNSSVLNNATILGGVLHVGFGAVVNGGTIATSSLVQLFGLISSTTIGAPVSMIVFQSGSSVDATLAGRLIVASGAVAGTTVVSGGTLELRTAGGTVTGTVVSGAGASELVGTSASAST